MTVLVQQRSPHDCAVCCMAMLTGRTYEDVRAVIAELLDETGERRGMRNEQEALRRLGFEHSFHHGQPIGDISCTRRGFEISPEYYRGAAWGRRALMSVPSLNFSGSWHMIFWDGSRIWDPSPLTAYTTFEQLRPDEMVLFRETPAAAS